MNINIITLFPGIFEALNYGLLGQAIEREDIKINIFNLRNVNNAFALCNIFYRIYLINLIYFM